MFSKRSLVAMLFTAMLLLLGSGCSGNGDESKTYSNSEFGYRLSFPGGWQIETRELRPSDDFESQSVRLTDRDNHVSVVVNFQGGWCESGITSENAIVTAGVPGREYVCSVVDGEQTTVRYYEGAKGRMNYTVIGTTKSNAEAVRSIIDSFTFTN